MVVSSPSSRIRWYLFVVALPWKCSTWLRHWLGASCVCLEKCPSHLPYSLRTGCLLFSFCWTLEWLTSQRQHVRILKDAFYLVLRGAKYHLLAHATLTLESVGDCFKTHNLSVHGNGEYSVRDLITCVGCMPVVTVTPNFSVLPWRGFWIYKYTRGQVWVFTTLSLSSPEEKDKGFLLLLWLTLTPNRKI